MIHVHGPSPVVTWHWCVPLPGLVPRGLWVHRDLHTTDTSTRRLAHTCSALKGTLHGPSGMVQPRPHT